MGNLCIPKKIDTESDIENVPVNAPQPETFAVDDPDEYDRLAVEVLKSEFKDDPETFILNQVLLCYMFFEDFTEEVRVLHHTISPKTQQLNSKLIQDHKKQFLMPDSILELVNKRVKLEYSSGPKKGAIEPLASQRLIILHDSVEIIDSNEGYASIDKPQYRAKLEESKDSTGFLKVNISDSISNFYDDYKRSSGNSVYSAVSTKYKKRKSILTPISTTNGELLGIARNDSGPSTERNSEPEYEYTRITAAQTPKIIDITEVDTNTNICQLPTNCIVKFKEKNIDLDSDDDDEDENVDNRSNVTRMENNLYINKYYLNSTEFMKHFQNTVFPNHIGELLGFSKNFIRDAKSIPGAMFCHRNDYNNAFWDIGDFCDSKIEFQIIPAISMPGLHKSAFEWLLRKRPSVYDKHTRQSVCYKWPTAKMVAEAKTLHSIIVPKGFMPKKKENPQMHLEWEVQFPKIEKYLEFRMSHAQIRVFLYLIVLFKKFVEPLTQKHGLSVEHLRFLMFKECEANYRDWLEDKLGTKIKAVLTNLYGYLGRSCLPHYFIKDKNVFENIPRKYLISNQEVIHNILESPLSYFLTALKDLKYYSDKFYSQPNIEELENILKLENVLTNVPISTRETGLQKQKREFNLKRDKDAKNKLDKEDKWRKKYVEMKRLDAQNQQEIEEQNARNLTSDRQELSLDVNINFKKKLCKAEAARQTLVFTYFIKQYIKIAQKSLKISSTNQTMFYLKQARYLTKLLDEIASESLNVKEYQSKISFIERKCITKMVEETPETPKRNSSTLVFNSDILQVKGKDINMSKLNMSYNSTMFAKQGKPTTSNMKWKSTPKDEDTNNNNSRMTNGMDDENGYNSDLENSNFENIEVTADVHNVTAMEKQKASILRNKNEEMDDVINELEDIIEIENQKNGNDVISLNRLNGVAEVHNVTVTESDVNDEKISLTDLENDSAINNIVSDSEKEIEVKNQKEDKDTISLQNFFSLDDGKENTKNEEKIDTDIITLNHFKSTSEEIIPTNDKEDINSTSNGLEKSNVENIEVPVDVKNQKNDDLNSSKNNSEIITNTDQNNGINNTTTDLEKHTIKKEGLVADEHTVLTTEDNRNVNDKNILNDLKNTPKIFPSQNGDINDTPNNLEKPELKNDKVNLYNKNIIKKKQKNVDLNSSNKLINFSLRTFEERNKV